MNIAFLKKLLRTPGIPGFEERVRAVWRGEVKAFSHSQQTDMNGSEIATIRGRSSRTSILLMGHIDQLGLIVRYIDESGYLYFAPVGSFDNVTLVSQKVKVCGPKGDIPGVIGKVAVHLQPRDERNTKTVKIEDLWIDIGATSREEAQQYAPIGTPVMVGEEYVELLNGRVATRFDNRFGAFVVAEVMRRLWEKRDSLFPTVHGAATVQEETSIGSSGAGAVAYRLMPSAAIAVDVNHAIDIPGVDKRLHGDAKMSQGPVLNVGVNSSNKLAAAIRRAAEESGFSLQFEHNSGRSFTDADAMPDTRTGVPGIYFGNPLRYMHNTVEVADMADVEGCVDVLETYLLSIEKDVDYTP